MHYNSSHTLSLLGNQGVNFMYRTLHFTVLATVQILIIGRFFEKMMVLFHDARFITSTRSSRKASTYRNDKDFQELSQEIRHGEAMLAARRLYRQEPALFWVVMCFMTWLVIILF
jgi:hypothetical protein